MSYCRKPYYIYSDVSNNRIFFNGYYISNQVVDVFLYKLFLDFNRDDLKERLKDGKSQIINDVELHYKNNEDELLKDLLDERYCSVEESIIESLKQVKLIREGKLPKKTWRDFMKELEEYSKIVENEEILKNLLKCINEFKNKSK